MDYLVLDVSGTRYHLLNEVIEKFPQSLLYKAIKTDYDYTGLLKRPNSTNRFFAQRSPIIFDTVILPFYITGNIHIPPWLCKESVREELQFWQLDPNFCRSCVEDMFDYVPSKKEQNDVSPSPTVLEGDSLPETKSIREIMWDLCDNPGSSKAATVKNASLIVMSNFTKTFFVCFRALLLYQFYSL